MTMAKRVDRDAGGEIEIALATLANQITALASDRTYATPRIDGHERSDGHGKGLLQSQKSKKGGPPGPPGAGIYLVRPWSVNTAGSNRP
jgi:hypothetical protein